MTIFNVTDDTTFDNALAAAVDGDTINLAAGVYSLAHTVAKDLTINGAKVGVAGDAAGRGLAESILAGGLKITAAGVTIDGAQVTGANEFGNAGLSTGLYVLAPGATVQNVRFDGTTGVVGLLAGGGATGLSVTHNAFAGYDNGIYAVEGAAGSITSNVFSQTVTASPGLGEIGIFTESTGLTISLNTFLNGGGAGAAVFSSPNGSTDLSTQVLANNTIPSLPGGAHSINIDVRGTGAATVTGTAFDDAIYTADYPNHPTSLVIRGLGGSDAIWGGDGNDTIDGGDGNDFLNGELGVNSVSYAEALSAVTVSLAVQNGVLDGNDLPTATQNTGGAGIDALANFQNLIGSAFNDMLTGDGNANVITGGAGVDTISGGIGNDTFIVSTGDVVAGETYNGGADTDALEVHGTADFTGSSLLSMEKLVFAPGASSATFTSSQLGGANVAAALAVTGDTGANSIVVNMTGTLLDLSLWTFTSWTLPADTITINGTTSADTITGSSQNDIITGGLANDLIQAGAGDDTIKYTIGDGSDSIDGGSNTAAGDTLAITGTAANDALAVVVSGSTILSMAAGTVTGIEHVTLDLLGGTGDTLDYSGSTAVVVDLSANTGTGFDSVNGVENVTGGSGADALIGDGSANVLDGGANDDTLTGKGGIDTLLGKAGNDTFIVNASDAVAGETYDGGTEIDTLQVAGTADFTGSSLLSIEKLTFATAATSTVTLTSSQIGGSNLAAALAVTGDAQTNNIIVNMNGTALDLSGWTFTTWTAGTDTITVNGSAAANTITGSSQNDVITGGGGVDTISAGAGNDILTVAAGDAAAGETYDGGANSDTLRVTGTSDFTGSSLLSIENLTFATAGTSTVTLTSSQVGGANLSATLAVTGDANTNGIAINLNGTLLDLSGWTFASWTAGTDTITVTGSSSADAITGSSENDIITGGLGADAIIGGAGDDRINYTVGDGTDSINGGTNTATGDTVAVTGTAGNDTLAVVVSGSTITGLGGGTVTAIEHVTIDLLGGGSDTLDYTGTTTAIVVNLAGTQSATGFDTTAGVENVTGGSGADTLTGNTSVNALIGGAGDDILVVSAGDAAAGETYDGGTNTATGDTLKIIGTGSSNFTGSSLLSIENLLFATSGTSTVTLTSGQVGGANLSGSLAVTGDANQNKIVINMTGTSVDLSAWTFATWTAGTDTITITGTAAGDTITGSTRNDIISGGLGIDAIQSGAGDDLINYVVGDGADLIDGGTNTGIGDTLAISGTAGNDTLAVTVTGGTITSFAGSTLNNVEHVTIDLLGGTGDALDYSATTQAVTVNLTTPSATGFDSIAGVENVTGGTGADALTGDANANVLDGGANDDTLTGKGGIDTLLGKAGNDTLVVNAGDAVAGETYDGGANSDTLQVTGTSDFTGSSLLSIESLTFLTSGTSTVTLTASQIGGPNLSTALAVTGDANTNNIVVNTNGTALDLSGWTFSNWTAGTDTVTVNGSAAADMITGSVQSDIIGGGAGLDVIRAGTGNDKLNGGAGGDALTGGLGADVFVLDALADAQHGVFDRITDYDRGGGGAFSAAEGDQIDLSALLSTAYNNGAGQPVGSLVRALSSGTDATIQIDTDGAANGASWVTIGHLDGLQAGNTVNVILDSSAPGGTTISVTAPPAVQFPQPTLAVANFGAGAGGWTSDDHYPRELADVNGDGMADIVGFGEAGALVALATGGGSFAPASLALANFGAGASAGGWTSDDHFPRTLADVNGDGMADIVGFGQAGVLVALATGGGSFAPASLALANFGAGAGAGGWISDDHFPRELADVNGDGMADIVGFGQAGVLVSLATGGGSFAAPSLTLANFGAGAGGWSSDDHYPRELADVNGDGMADIVGFGEAGALVAFATGGGFFAPASLALANFGAGAGAGGWTSDNLFPRTLADVNGDHRADIVGFGNSGVLVSVVHDFLP